MQSEQFGLAFRNTSRACGAMFIDSWIVDEKRRGLKGWKALRRGTSPSSREKKTTLLSERLLRPVNDRTTEMPIYFRDANPRYRHYLKRDRG